MTAASVSAGAVFEPRHRNSNDDLRCRERKRALLPKRVRVQARDEPPTTQLVVADLISKERDLRPPQIENAGSRKSFSARPRPTGK